MNGIINVYKEKGFTSFDVCAKLRGILKTRKIGHTGTLDPDAVGVLPVCVGNATKLCDLLTDKDKTYEAVLLLGVTTDTEDITGTVLTECEVNATEQEVRDAMMKFVGEYAQVPPMYSAIKVNGKKLYELAREGKVIERQARNITIHEIDILEMTFDEAKPEIVKEVRFAVTCSKGTYIRTLCKDIGEALSCGGCMKSLIRTRVSAFTIDQSKTLSEIDAQMKEQGPEGLLIPVDVIFDELPKAYVKEECCKFLYNGNQLKKTHFEQEDMLPEAKVRVYDCNKVFTGIYEYDTEKRQYKPVKMFL